MAPPSLYFGGGTIGADHLNTTNGVANLLQSLQKLDIWRLDTAPVYPATNPGKCEQVLGDVGAIQLGFRVATKIKVIGAGPGKGSLTKDAIDASIAESLAKLRTEQVDVLYCHTPDIETPVEETAAALHAQYERQRFLQLGLSNYNADQVQEYLTICEQHGYIKPTVYQGSYNAVARQAEERLLPLLRKHGITFIAYSPLAGGFLTGKLTNQTSLSGSRFEKGHPMGDFIRGIYDKPAMHSAVRTLQSVLDQVSIPLTQAALRWIYYHSALGKDDGIILGASKMEQVTGNVEGLKLGPLPEGIVMAFEKTWEGVR